jgi:CRP-like cAMP-binding protein
MPVSDTLGSRARGQAAFLPSKTAPFQFVSNRLLAALPDADRRRLEPHLFETRLGFKRVLHQPEQPIEQVYFPDSAVCSIVSVMRDGASTAVATVGNEGLIGLVLFYGENADPSSAIVHVPGRGRALPARIFSEELERRAALHRIVGYYAYGRVIQIMQTNACNQFHPVRARTCNWLLKTHDRVLGDEFNLTQELLSLMLGARRPTVSGVARELQDEGLIRCRHGKVTILDRKGLEAEACECYAMVRDYFNRFLQRLPA